jgi:hypothetical protein
MHAPCPARPAVGALLTLVLLTLLCVSPPTARASAEPSLLVERLDADWQAQVLAPVLQRLRRLGDYEPRVSEAAVALAVLAAEPTPDLALLRRSRLGRTPVEGVELLAADIAACLLLAVRDEAPWRSYAELSYDAGRDHLQAVAGSPDASAGFERLRAALPLASTWQVRAAPAAVAIEAVASGDAQLLLLELTVAGLAPQPPAVLDELAARGLRILPMPTRLFAPDSGLQSGGLPLRSAAWLRPGSRHDTLCDPLVLVFNSAVAGSAIQRLHSPDPLPDAADGGLPQRFRARLQGLLSALGSPWQ